MIAQLLADLRDGWTITSIVPWRGSYAWRLSKRFDVQYVPLPAGWVPPQ